MSEAIPIDSLKFGIFSQSEIKRLAVCQITESNIYDDNLGIISHDYEKCKKCGMAVKNCPGHFGYIKLEERIIHPLYKPWVLSFLKCFCGSCFRLVVDEDHLALWGLKFKGENRFNKILEKIDKFVNRCCHCSENHFKIIYKSKEDVFYKEHKDKKDDDKNSRISPIKISDIYHIFKYINEEDIKLLGFDPKLLHPKNLIMKYFPVLPTCVRPYIITDGNKCSDDLTNLIIEIIKDNAKILAYNGLEENDKKTNKLAKKTKPIDSLKFHISVFFHNNGGQAKRPTDKQPIKGLKQRLSGKKGQMRCNHMGKRVDFSARTVIGAEPFLKLNEMAIPYEVAEKLTFPEKVNSANIKYLENLVNKEKKANFVIRMKDGKQTIISLAYALKSAGTELQHGDVILKPSFEISHDENGNVIIPKVVKNINIIPNFFIYDCRNTTVLKEGDRIVRKGKLLENIKYPSNRYFKLQIGDIVERHLRNGDVVLLNRQPTLHRGGMLAMKVVLRPYQTFRFNLAGTKTFNADYDHQRGLLI